MRTEGEMLAAALEYAAHGVRLFPIWGVVSGLCRCGNSDCENVGKHPHRLAPQGFKNATTDDTQIREWWQQEPDANIGMPTDRRFVLDVDPRHGGDETLAALEGQHGRLPVTQTVDTGGGGRHFHLEQPTPPLGNSTRKLGPGLDTRGVGGYVLLPPSRHASGRRYSDDPDRALFKAPLASVPAWMLALLAEPTRNGGPAMEATDWAVLLAGTPQGERHAAATRIAGHFLGRGLPPAEVEQILLGFCARCAPPFPEGEARRIVSDLGAKDSRAARILRGSDRQNPERHVEVPDGVSGAETPPLFGERPLGDSGARAGRTSTAAQALAIIAQPAELFHSADGRAYVTVEVNGHLETWPVRSKRFKAWLGRAFYATARKPAPTQAMAEALALAEARALDGAELAVHVRVAESEGKVYIDLADERWRVVEVDAAGWCVLARGPVKFHRAAGMLALPAPVPGETLHGLRAFINVGDESTWRLLVHWLVMALRPRGPYPVLGLFGEQGSAKSTATRVLRELVDPNAAPLRSEPREPRDLMIAAEHGWMTALDNISHLPAWLSDALCRLSTGGGFATRELFTDSEEIIFSAMRPVIVNGIEEIITRGDLMQRSLLVELPVIAPKYRRAEGEFWRAFEAARPGIFGALLDALAAAIREAPNVRLPALPRMADFAEWSVAAERGLGWPPGGFLRAYTENIASAHELVLDASPVAQPVRALAAEGEWSGTVAELLDTLALRVDEGARRAKGWPGNAKALAGILRRLAPNLRAVGVAVTFLGRTKRGRPVRLEPIEPIEVGK